ncbi:hypothetical protein [Pseudomonas sp. RIT623]|uniref:hypothetical protein n=1 Tax=Pseudomonas sp. RIT623 TaxID=2559075 RepID=UPI00106F2F9F|nr:hypothetical protein [Pseudomonas sp. RIT623]TFF38662.1 hypothetical protein E3U47_15650 [Pseudomonas sp. RIT623]
MWVLGKGQKPFLELLRNLSIQFIITSFIALLAYKAGHAFDTHRSADGWVLIFVLSVLSAILGLAVIANLKPFFAAFIHDEAAGFHAHKASLPDMPRGARFKSCALFLVKQCKLALFESVLLVLGIYLASIIGLFVAINSAASAFGK